MIAKASVPQDLHWQASISRHSDDHSYGTDWWGRPTVQAVIESVEKGWPEGLERIRAALGQLSIPKLQSIRRKRSRSSFGDEVDMQRVYAGDLERAWTTSVRTMSDVRSTTPTSILVDICGDANCSSESLFWSGATAVALAEAFHRSGRACEIVAYLRTDNATERGNNIFCAFKVQPAGTMVDLEHLAAVLGLSGFFRYYGWKAIHAVPANDVVRDGLGHHNGNLPEGFTSGKAVHIKAVNSLESAKRFLKEATKGL